MKKLKKQNTNQAIVIYKDKNKNIKIKVNIYKDTVWLSQMQMAELFNTTKQNISLHLNNIFKEKEINRHSVVKDYLTTADDGKNYTVKYYNLDAIISVGYRINSKAGTTFRIWATKTLKQYLLKGFVLNEKRLLEQQKKDILNLQNTIELIYNKIKTPLLVGQEQELIGIIQRYIKSLSILRQYDHNLLKNIANIKSKFILEYEDCLNIINNLKKELEKVGEITELFGCQNSNEKLKGIIGALYQTFDKKELYSTIEEKSANLLYLVIKDHPFIDGNKRIGSILFVYFLNKNNFLFNKKGEIKISDNMLATLALLVAISDPIKKDVMINLIINLIKS